MSSLEELHSKFNRDISLEELELHVRSNNSLKDEDDKLLSNAIDTIRSSDVGEDVLSDVLKSIRLRTLASELAITSLGVAEGSKSREDLDSLITRFREESEGNNSDVSDESEFVTDDLDFLYEQHYKKPGLRWRLHALNRSLGSLRKGDFGFIFARPESFSRDTEILTPNGWVRVDQVTNETYISQVNPDLSVSFVKPSAIHPHEQTHCYHIHDELGRVDLIVTQGHGMIYEKEGILYKERADQVKYKQGIKHHVAAVSSVPKGTVDFLPEHRLLIAYQADGHTRNYKEYGYTFSFKKERKKDRLKEILSQCKYEYSEYKDGNKGHTGYYVKSKIKLVKNFDWINLALVTKEWCQQFIEEISYWDATRRTDCRFKYDTVDFNTASKVQAIAILAGYNCLLSTHIDDRSPKYSDIYSLSIRTDYQPIDGQSIKKELIPFSDTTYCFEVPSGMLLVRRNGAVAVSGNTGKTTFLASEITYMAEQLKEDDGPILWLNNEEQGDKVKVRLFVSSCGVPTAELMSNRERFTHEYNERTKRKIKLKDNAALHRSDIERLCKQIKPSLIVVDQIDKIKGFAADREDLRLGAIYIWARELAKQYCPIIGVCQADGTGEGVRWLTMDHVSNAKTSKQAEADFILGIGKIHDPVYENVRFINISKNKLQGDEDSEPKQRHARIQCLIEPEIQRYTDIV